MKNLVKIGIFAFAFGLFATACTSPGNKNNSNADTSTVEQTAPMQQAAPATMDTSSAAPMDTSSAATDTTQN